MQWSSQFTSESPHQVVIALCNSCMALLLFKHALLPRPRDTSAAFLKSQTTSEAAAYSEGIAAMETETLL